jgi:YHS domain-containing protein
MRKDPVCGMPVDERRATSISHQGDQDYYFCSLGCKQRFEQNSGCYRQCDSACVSGYSPWSGYPDPPDSYSLSDCVRWARHRDSAPATGTLTFSKLRGCS